MARPRGQPKLGGRKPGTPNKHPRASVEETLARMGCDPIEGLATIAMDEEIETGLRLKAYAELAKYVHPQKKAMELSNPEGQELVIRHITVGQTPTP